MTDDKRKQLENIVQDIGKDRVHTAAVARHLVYLLGRSDSAVEERAAAAAEGILAMGRDDAFAISRLLEAEIQASLVIPTREQEASCDLLASAVAHPRTTDGIVFLNEDSIRQFYERMLSGNDAGIADAAMLFTRCLSDRHDETVVAAFLTQLALTHYEDADKEARRQPLLEADLGLMGAFVNALVGPIEYQGSGLRDYKNPNAELNTEAAIRSRCERLVRIIAIMAKGDGVRKVVSGVRPGLKRSTELIRGMLFAPRFDHRRARLFWELAAASPDFPEFIFSDPSRVQHNPSRSVFPMFSPDIKRAYGNFLDVVPDTVASRFGRAIARANVCWCADINRETGSFNTWMTVASEEERLASLREIAGHVSRDNIDRRTMLLDLFRLTSD